MQDDLESVRATLSVAELRSSTLRPGRIRITRLLVLFGIPKNTFLIARNSSSTLFLNGQKFEPE